MNKKYIKECESSCEYTLPDYLGDVKKILCVKASVIPSGKFSTEGELNFSGIVAYDVLYSDSEGKLTGLTLNSDYDVSVPVDSESYIDSRADTSVANLAVRLTGPRKLSAKATLSSRVRISCEPHLRCSGEVFSGEFRPEIKEERISIEKSAFFTSKEREYAEETVRLGGIGADSIEIIATSGAVRVIESTVENGEVRVRGEITVTSIIRTDEQPPFAIKKVIPFDESIDLEGMNAEGAFAFADGYLSSVTAGVSEDAEGASVNVNVISELRLAVSKNEEHTVVADAYLKERDTSVKYEETEYSSLLCMAGCEEKISCSVSRSEVGIEQVREVLTMTVDLRQTEKTLTDNGFTVSGEAIFSGVACEDSNDGEINYAPIKFTSPFKINVSCNMPMPPDAEIELNLSAKDVESIIDAEKITANCHMSVAYRVTKNGVIKRAVECNLSGEAEYTERPSRISVYMPCEGESLFDIAKKFHTTGIKIAEDNELSDAVLSEMGAPVSNCGVKKLIIRR